MHAYQGDLTDPSDPDPSAFSASSDADGRFRDFDVAGVGLGFHHFADPELSARRIVERLRPGGVFVILDFLPHGATDAALPAANTVVHHGFSRERMRAVFEQAGASRDFAMEEIGSGGMATDTVTIMDISMATAMGMDTGIATEREKKE
ncbi:SAM-dependent methyltransferase [Colletotrichum higginsianum]|nr:SAM-dependent methyltransferase [Colletotrichum higginsianum]